MLNSKINASLALALLLPFACFGGRAVGQDEAKILAEIAKLDDAWMADFNEHDASTLAKQYAEKCDVVHDGQVRSSRGEMEREFHNYFLENQLVTCTLTNLNHRVLSPTLVVESGTEVEVGVENSPPVHFDYTTIFEKRDDKWQIVYERAWKNPRPASDKIDLETVKTWSSFLDGEWDFVLTQGETVEGTAKWTRRSDGELMTCVFSSDAGEAHELAGWRPESGQWTAQGYGAGGNHWTLEFVKGDEQSMQANYRGRRDDGAVFEGDFVGRKVDENNYRWDATTKDTSGEESKSSGVYKRKSPR